VAINKRRVIQIFNDMLPQITTGISSPSQEPDRVFIIEGFSMTLTGRSLELFNECVDEIRNDRSVAISTSLGFVENLVARCVKECLQNNIADAEPIVRTHLAIFDGALNEYQYYAPIDNLILNNLSLLVGNIRFLTFDESTYQMWFNKYSGYENKEAIAQRVEPLKNMTIAQIQVSAFDEDRAIQVGSQEIEIALNVLRWIGYMLYGTMQRAWIGISGDVHRQMSLPSLLEKGDSLKLPRSRKGAVRTYEIDEEAVDLFKKLGLSKISQILMKPQSDRTDMESRLLTAINFFGKAVQETDSIDAFLKTTIAMETLLIRDNTEPITGNLAERTAFLLGDSLEARLELRKLVSTLYGTRSRITHHGSTDNAVASLETLQNICFDLLYKITDVVDQYKTIKDLIVWIDELKYS